MIAILRHSKTKNCIVGWIDKKRALRRLENKFGRLHMSQDRLQKVIDTEQRKSGESRSTFCNDVQLPLWPTLELGLCGGTLKSRSSSTKVKFVGWNVIDVDMAQGIGSHHGLYEHIQNSIEYHNPTASENMASVLGLDPTFSMLDKNRIMSTKLKSSDFYDSINSIQSRAWSMNRIKLGNEDNKKGQYDIALRWYNQAITIDPLHADAYVARGAAYANRKEYDKAMKDFNKALLLDSDVDNGRQYLINVKEAKRVEEVSASLKRGVERSLYSSISPAPMSSSSHGGKSSKLWPKEGGVKKKQKKKK